MLLEISLILILMYCSFWFGQKVGLGQGLMKLGPLMDKAQSSYERAEAIQKRYEIAIEDCEEAKRFYYSQENDKYFDPIQKDL